ncbi:MAG: VCBS repeat-containing protein, partial [Acidobacteriota bacterium]|nr:VCBS repeat-containing protein [Acidobacteriota bacterium]
FPNLTTGVTQQVSPARVGYGFSPAVRFVRHNSQTTNVDFTAVPFGSPKGETANDFDGDGASDISVFRRSDATWYIAPSSQQQEVSADTSAAPPGSFTGVRWGLPTDVITPADFDGDGKTDVAVWRAAADAGNPDRSYFYILNSSNNSVRAEQFGSPNDLPFLAGDWDGDGKADPAVYRGGTTANAQGFFFYRPSASPGVDFRTVYWGTAGDRPVRGDFDGDGKLDAAVFRPSDGIWHILQSSNGQARYAHWGLSDDKLVAADYDADGKTDLAVFRPSSGTWYIRQSSDNQMRSVKWGLATDAPVPADYDGDGKTDVAVNRAGVWYILESLSGQMRATQFGSPTDAPVAAAAGFYNPNN